MDENDLKLAANNAYDVVVKALSLTPYHVLLKQRNKLLFNCRLKEDIMPCSLYVAIEETRQRVRAVCYVPFRFSEDMYIDGCKATSFINLNLPNGAFCLDVTNGYLSFVISESYNNSPLTVQNVVEMINLLAAIVQRNKNKFELLARGSITIEEFFKLQ